MSPADKQFLFADVPLREAAQTIENQIASGRKLCEAMSGPGGGGFGRYILVFYPKQETASPEVPIPGYDSPPVDDSGVAPAPVKRPGPGWNRPSI